MIVSSECMLGNKWFNLIGHRFKSTGEFFSKYHINSSKIIKTYLVLNQNKK